MHYICIFFFNDTATTEIYTLSLHDALPILGVAFINSRVSEFSLPLPVSRIAASFLQASGVADRASGKDSPLTRTIVSISLDRKSTRLNSSHANISYAVFCLKKKTEYIPIAP